MGFTKQELKKARELLIEKYNLIDYSEYEKRELTPEEKKLHEGLIELVCSQGFDRVTEHPGYNYFKNFKSWRRNQGKYVLYLGNGIMDYALGIQKRTTYDGITVSSILEILPDGSTRFIINNREFYSNRENWFTSDNEIIERYIGDLI